MFRPLHAVTAAVNTHRHAPEFSLEGMNPSERLARLMAARGIVSRAELGQLAGIPGGTVRQHLSRGSISKEAAGAYARVLRCSVDWLLFGRGSAPTLEVFAHPHSGAQEPAATYTPPPPAPRRGSIAEELAAIALEIDRLEERLRALRDSVGTL